MVRHEIRGKWYIRHENDGTIRVTKRTNVTPAERRVDISIQRLSNMPSLVTATKAGIDAFIAREPESVVQADSIIMGMRWKLGRMPEDNVNRTAVLNCIRCWELIADRARHHDNVIRLADAIQRPLD